ncbi:hypothetical protein JOC77_000238 [Peribacillus deserti]|uniref:Uncharacterized protein n=1 Tax=Peribacillus deserti TaxID=673318 RepID=A0ABS2QCW3_9BACI|nr:hypothetical protein [Peribacillus deserti]
MNFSSESENFAKGLLWGTALSIPLWLAIFGWIKLLLSVM